MYTRPSLLPYLLEKVGAHATAHYRVQHVEHVPAPVDLTDTVRAYAQVDVLQVLFVAFIPVVARGGTSFPAVGPSCRDAEKRRPISSTQVSWFTLPLMVTTCLRPVEPLEITLSSSPLSSSTDSLCTQYGHSQGMFFVAGGIEHVVDVFLRIILDHLDLLSDDVALLLDVLGTEERIAVHVGNDV